MPRRGRKLETLVEAIESAFKGEDVTVKSPDSVLGLQSGSLREIDVSLRGKVGSADLFVIVECRDRSGAQGVDWIEQLASKREDVGAQLALAVSASGFTNGAQKLAAARHVVLRHLRELKKEELQGLYRLEDSALVAKRFELTDLFLIEGDPEGTETEVAGASEISTTTSVIGFGSNEPSMTVRNLEEQIKNSLHLYEGLDDALPEELPPVGTQLSLLKKAGIVVCELSSRRGPPYFQTPDGRTPIAAVAVRYRSWVQLGRMRVETWRKYLGQEAAIAYAASGFVNFGEAQRADFILQDPSSQRAVIRIYGDEDA